MVAKIENFPQTSKSAKTTQTTPEHSAYTTKTAMQNHAQDTNHYLL